MKGLFKNFKNIAFTAFASLAITTSAQAVNIDFGESGLFIAFDQATGTDFNFGSFGDDRSSSSLVFDELTNSVIATVAGLGTINDAATNAELNQTNFTYSLTVTDVTQAANGDLVTTDATNGIATYTLDNVAGFGEISGTVETHMFLGGTDGLTVLDLTTDTGITAAAWFTGIGDIIVNGGVSNAFVASGGDLGLRFGVEAATIVPVDAEVPEPATVLLLGLGAVGGALKRRKLA